MRIIKVFLLICCGVFGFFLQAAILYQDFLVEHEETWKPWHEIMRSLIASYGGPDWWQGLGMTLMYCSGLWVCFLSFYLAYLVIKRG